MFFVGLIHTGDEVHEVNGINIRGKSPHDVVNILVSNCKTYFFFLFKGQTKYIFFLCVCTFIHSISFNEIQLIISGRNAMAFTSLRVKKFVVWCLCQMQHLCYFFKYNYFYFIFFICKIQII